MPRQDDEQTLRARMVRYYRTHGEQYYNYLDGHEQKFSRHYEQLVRDSLAVVQSRRPAPVNILELGCGTGAVYAKLQVAGAVMAAGIDLYRSHDSHNLVLGDIQALPLADASVDFIFCNQVLEHVPLPASLFREIRRVLRPQGRVLIRTVNKISPALPLRTMLFALLPMALVRRIYVHHTPAVLQVWSTAGGRNWREAFSLFVRNFLHTVRKHYLKEKRHLLQEPDLTVPGGDRDAVYLACLPDLDAAFADYAIVSRLEYSSNFGRRLARLLPSWCGGILFIADRP